MVVIVRLMLGGGADSLRESRIERLSGDLIGLESEAETVGTNGKESGERLGEISRPWSRLFRFPSICRNWTGLDIKSLGVRRRFASNAASCGIIQRFRVLGDEPSSRCLPRALIECLLDLFIT